MFLFLLYPSVFLTVSERTPHRTRAYSPPYPSISLAIHGYISFYIQSVFLNALKVHYLPILKASFSPSYSSVPFAIFLTAPEPYSSPYPSRTHPPHPSRTHPPHPSVFLTKLNCVLYCFRSAF